MSGQTLEPAYFNQDASTDQTVFAENRAQGLGFAGVAAVDLDREAPQFQAIRPALPGLVDVAADQRAQLVTEQGAQFALGALALLALRLAHDDISAAQTAHTFLIRPA